MFICSEEKDDYHMREITIPEKNDPKFRQWKTEIVW